MAVAHRPFAGCAARIKLAWGGQEAEAGGGSGGGRADDEGAQDRPWH